MAYNLLNPVTALKTRVDLAYLRRYGGEFADMHGEIQRFDAAREVHERLSRGLGEKRTFFDEEPEEIKEDGVWEEVKGEEDQDYVP